MPTPSGARPRCSASSSSSTSEVIYAPIWELAFLNGVGPRVREIGPGPDRGHAYSAPYEDITLKGK